MEEEGSAEGKIERQRRRKRPRRGESESERKKERHGQERARAPVDPPVDRQPRRRRDNRGNDDGYDVDRGRKRCTRITKARSSFVFCSLVRRVGATETRRKNDRGKKKNVGKEEQGERDRRRRASGGAKEREVERGRKEGKEERRKEGRKEGSKQGRKGEGKRENRVEIVGHVRGAVLAGSRDVMVRSSRRASYQDCSRSRVRDDHGEECDGVSDDNERAIARESLGAPHADGRSGVATSLRPLHREKRYGNQEHRRCHVRCYVPLPAGTAARCWPRRPSLSLRW